MGNEKETGVDVSEIVGLVSVEERASLGKCGKEEESSQISEVGEVRREESQRKKGVFGIFPRGSRRIVEDDGGKVEKRRPARELELKAEVRRWSTWLEAAERK